MYWCKSLQITELRYDKVPVGVCGDGDGVVLGKNKTFKAKARTKD